MISTGLRIFNLYYIYRISAKIEIDLSNLIFKNNIYQSYSKYTKKNSSHIISILADKVPQSSAAISAFLNVLAGSILGLFMIISLVFIDWRFIIFGIIFLFITYFIIYKRVRRYLYNSGQRISKKLPYRLRILQEVFFGFRDVIINQNQKLYTNLFKKKAESGIKLIYSNAITFIQAFPRYLIEVLLFLFLIIICYTLIQLNINLLRIIPTFAGYIYVFQRLIPLLNQIYGALASYNIKSAGILDVLKELRNNDINNKAI